MNQGRILKKPSVFMHMEEVRVEMFGNRKAVVEGCTGILEYEKDKITVKTCTELKICFNGRELQVCCMDRESLVVEGNILTVSYMR